MPGLPLPASTHIALVHKFVRIFPVVKVCRLLEKYRRVTRGLPGYLIVDSSHRLVNGELVDRVLPPRVCFTLLVVRFARLVNDSLTRNVKRFVDRTLYRVRCETQGRNRTYFLFRNLAEIPTSVTGCRDRKFDRDRGTGPPRFVHTPAPQFCVFMQMPDGKMLVRTVTDICQIRQQIDREARVDVSKTATFLH